MSKVVKLNIKDVKQIVENTIKEMESHGSSVTFGVEDGEAPKHKDVTIAKDDKGHYYVIDSKTGDILGQK